MLLFLQCLQSHGVIGEGVLNVPEIRLIADDLLAARVVEKPGSKHTSRLVVGHVQDVILIDGLIAVIVSMGALADICQALVDESAQLERGRVTELLTSDVGHEPDQFCFIDDVFRAFPFIPVPDGEQSLAVSSG